MIEKARPTSADAHFTVGASLGMLPFMLPPAEARRRSRPHDEVVFAAPAAPGTMSGALDEALAAIHTATSLLSELRCDGGSTRGGAATLGLAAPAVDDGGDDGLSSDDEPLQSAPVTLGSADIAKLKAVNAGARRRASASAIACEYVAYADEVLDFLRGGHAAFAHLFDKSLRSARARRGGRADAERAPARGGGAAGPGPAARRAARACARATRFVPAGWALELAAAPGQDLAHVLWVAKTWLTTNRDVAHCVPPEALSGGADDPVA
ncbi:sodium solute symporter [Aureococcus anophagefferens]|nr:sodium solute symporter [Aureococcus anophagefferens]